MCITINHLFLLNSFMSCMMQFSNVAESEVDLRPLSVGLFWGCNCSMQLAKMLNRDMCALEKNLNFLTSFWDTAQSCSSGTNLHFPGYVGCHVWRPELTGPIFPIYFNDALGPMIDQHHRPKACPLNLTLTVILGLTSAFISPLSYLFYNSQCLP